MHANTIESLVSTDEIKEEALSNMNTFFTHLSAHPVV